MIVKAFIDSVRELLLTNKEEFEFANPSDASIFLQGFRTRHVGEFEGNVWTMLRINGKRPVEIKVTLDSTIINRRSMIEILNSNVWRVQKYAGQGQ